MQYLKSRHEKAGYITRIVKTAQSIENEIRIQTLPSAENLALQYKTKHVDLTETIGTFGLVYRGKGVLGGKNFTGVRSKDLYDDMLETVRYYL